MANNMMAWKRLILLTVKAFSCFFKPDSEFDVNLQLNRI